jgi:hypothetical protein
MLLAGGSGEPLFQRWIATYGGEEYGETVERVLEEMDRVGADLGPEQRAAVTQAFVTTSRWKTRSGGPGAACTGARCGSLGYTSLMLCH